jgi:ADP-heptose:LPS heptosyltransferase
MLPIFKKIGIVQVGRIGDLILLLPLFEALKKQYPQVELHLIASKWNKDIAQNYPFIDSIILYEKGFNFLKTIYQIRKQKYDIWIDPKDHHSGESRLFAKYCGAKFKIGYEKETSNLFDYKLQHFQEHLNLHQSKINLLPLHAFNLNSENNIPKLFIDSKLQENFDNFKLQNKFQNYYCVNLSGSNQQRKWETQKWIDFLNFIKNDISALILIGTKAELDDINTITKSINNCYYYSTKTIYDVYPVVAQADMIISPDTSIIHIAAAFDRPVLGLFSKNDNNNTKFFPLSKKYEIAYTDILDRPIDEISAEKLFEKYRLLNK